MDPHAASATHTLQHRSQLTHTLQRLTRPAASAPTQRSGRVDHLANRPHETPLPPPPLIDLMACKPPTFKPPIRQTAKPPTANRAASCSLEMRSLAGTSMSTPVVAGNLAIARQYLT